MARNRTLPLPADDTSTVHYFASTGLGWAVGLTVEDAIANLAEDVSRWADARYITRCLKSGGLYVWTCRVDLPISARYSIQSFAPHVRPDGTPVPKQDAREWRVLTRKGTAVEVPRSGDVVNRE